MLISLTVITHRLLQHAGQAKEHHESENVGKPFIWLLERPGVLTGEGIRRYTVLTT